MNKLHIGCGKCYLPGWINVDLFSSVNADVYADATALPYPRESFSLIYSSHILEHVHRHQILATLSHWRDLLVDGGVLRLAVPNFEACVERYNETGDLSELVGLLYGGQNFPKNSHHIIFDWTAIKKCLEAVGFKEVRLWDWAKTEHAQFDDYSQCYLPHLDKVSGMLMSLNVEATK